MNRTIELKIKCGDKTCARDPGVFCQYIAMQKFGTIMYCTIFSESNGKWMMPLDVSDGEDGDPHGGWTLRHPNCLAAEANHA